MSRSRRGRPFLVMLVIFCGCGHDDGYLITERPLVQTAGGLCVGINPNEPDGVWWWNVGRSGCSTRSSAIMHPADAIVRRVGHTVDVQFKVGMIAQPPQSLHIIVEDRSARLADLPTPITTPLIERQALDMSEEPCPCPKP